MFFVFLDHNFPSGSQEEAGSYPSYIQTKSVFQPWTSQLIAGHYFEHLGGFGTLLKGTSAVLQMCTRTSSGASTSSSFLALVPGTTNPPLPSFVPHRLTSTSLIFLFCCCFSVIVSGIQQKYNLDVVKLTKKLKFSRHKQQSSPAVVVGQPPIPSGESPEMVPCVSLFGHVTAG